MITSTKTSSSSSRSLTPSSPPFFFPRSSPTLTSHSDSNSGTTGWFSKTDSPSSSLSTSQSDTLTALQNKQDRDKGKADASVFTHPSFIPVSAFGAAKNKAKSFGAGWKSSSSPLFSKMKEVLLPNQETPYNGPLSSTPSRLPPTANGGGNLFPINTDPFSLPDLEFPSSPSTYYRDRQAPSFSPNSPYLTSPSSSIAPVSLHHLPSTSTIDIELDDHILFPPFTSPALSHHQSVPDLPFLQSSLARRLSGLSVRFKDDIPDVPEDIELDGVHPRGLRRMPAFNFGQSGLSRSRALSSKSMPAMQMLGEGRNVFIHRVNDHLTEDNLQAYASEFGDVVSVKIPTRTTRPHAFVMFKKPEQAQRFIVHLKLRNIDCEFGKEDYQVQNKALEDSNSANLYIAGLPTTMSYEELAELLSPGVICSWKPLIDEANNRRGPVMARLQTRPQAEEVIRRLNGRYYPGMSERLQVRIADSDEQKHFKRQQTIWRDRVPLEQHGHHVNFANSPGSVAEPMINNVEEVPDLLHTREYLASQLQAVEQKLARTNIGVVFPIGHGGYKDDSRPDPGHDTNHGWPHPDAHQAHHHRYASSNFSSDSLSTWPDHWCPSSAILGPAPQTWIRPGFAFHPNSDHTSPHRHPVRVGPRESGSDFPLSSRQQAVSFGTAANSPLTRTADTASNAGLHHVRSSPELGNRSDTASKMLWNSAE